MKGPHSRGRYRDANKQVSDLVSAEAEVLGVLQPGWSQQQRNSLCPSHSRHGEE